MKHFGLEIPEGTNGVVNLTAPIGSSFPSQENAGELFFRTDTNRLYVHGTTIGGSPPEWFNVIDVSFPLLAPDGTVSDPSYSWENEPGTGWYRPDVQTVTMSISGEDFFTLIRPGGGSPIPNVGSPYDLADIGIDFHILNDNAGDTQLRLETDATDKNALIHLITATNTWKITNETATDSLTFKSNDIEVLALNLNTDITFGVPITIDPVGSPSTPALTVNGEAEINDTLTVGPGGSPAVAIIANGDIEMNSQMRATDGSAGAPAYSFDSDTRLPER